MTPERETDEITVASPDHRKQHVRGLSLRRNFSWTFFGNVVHAACQWGVLVVLAKLGSPEMVGQYALGLAIATPIFMFTNLQLRGVQATDSRNDYSFVDYRSLRLSATGIGVVILIAVAIFSGFEPTTMLVILMVGVAKAFDGLSDVYYGYAQQKERMDLIARSMIFKGLLSLGAMTFMMFSTGSIVWASAGVAVAWVLRFFVYDMRFTVILPRSGKTTGFDSSRSVVLTKLALPLGLVMLLVSLNANIPRYIIQHEMGEQAVGFYSAIAYLMVAGTTVVGALGQAASPRLARQYASGNAAAFRRLLGKLVVIAIGVGFAGILISSLGGGPLLALIYTDEYAAYAILLTVIMGAGLVNYVASFLGYGLTAARYFRMQLPLSIVVVFTTLGTSFYLIPKFGLTGAAVSVLLAGLVNVVGAVGIVAFALKSNMQTLK